MSVVVLEAGRRFGGGEPLQNTEANAGKILWSEPRNFTGNDFMIPKAGMGVGGGTLPWLGVMPRFGRDDFRTHSTEGVGMDWPISYDDLRPHYERVEREFGVAGECGPFAAEAYTLPMPPHRMNWHAQVLARGARKLGAQPFAPPIAINSVERDGRPACIYCGWCGSGCPTEAKATSANTYLVKAERHGARVISEAGLLLMPAGKRAAGGPWRLDLDQKGNTTAFGEVTSLADTTSKDGRTKFSPTREATIHGVSKTMVHLAGNIFGRHLVGPAGLDGFEIPRASIRQLLMSDGWDASMLLPPASRHAYRTYSGAPEGVVTVKYDFLDQLKASPEARGALADSLQGGPSLGPVFLVTPVPGEAEKAVAVTDYSGYPLCLLDFSGLAEKRTVFKTPLPAKSALATGLGAYDSAWVAQGDEQWLFITGYTGMTRILFSKAGKVPDTMTSDVFHPRMSPEAVDGHVRGGLKQYDRIFAVVGGRMLDSGTGRPGRVGTPFTTGIEVFDLKDLRSSTAPIPSRTAANLSRCCGALNTLQSRIVWNAQDGHWRQEIFGSGRPSQVYVDELDAKDKPLVPPNMNEKIFLYEVSAQHGLRDLLGFTLPLTAQGQSVLSQLALSPCHRFLLILTDDATLYTWSIARRQFIDGIRLCHPSGEAMATLGFRRPGEKIITAPDGSLFILSAPGSQDEASVQFDRIDVSREGTLAIHPYLRIRGRDRADCEDLDNCVRCFMPDLKHADGSFDLIIGWDSKDRAQARPSVRVIKDFIPPFQPRNQ